MFREADGLGVEQVVLEPGNAFDVDIGMGVVQ